MTVSKAADKAPRKYRSPLRQEQAQRTRTAILDAAHRLFVTGGFGATTMKDIALEASVSVESVYAQGSKSALLLACVDRAVVGDDAEVPLIERPPMKAMMSGGDIDERLDILRRNTIDRLPAAAPIFEALRGAAAADPKLAAEWKVYDRNRYLDCSRLIATFADDLRPGLTVERATDMFWAFVSPAMMSMFCHERGWTGEQYADWLVDAVKRQLLA